MDAKLMLAASVLLVNSLPQLPDRLPMEDSAAFALAGERAQLLPNYRGRGLGLDFQGTPYNAHFYSWAVVPTWGKGIDYFSVDRRTGDVWADLGCELMRSPKLTALQARFRHQFHIPALLVRQIEKEGSPAIGCEAE